MRPLYTDSRRSLQWERELKSYSHSVLEDEMMSFPAMGTWIEICMSASQMQETSLSFPAMGTWIEIKTNRVRGLHYVVVPCNGNVD